MKKYLLLSALFLLFGEHIKAQNISDLLYDLEGVRFQAIEGTSDKYRLDIKQNLDHTDPSKGHFYQRVIFTHKGFDRPTVMNTQGYYVSDRPNEIALICEANYLNIEHRYFGTSRPDSLDWSYLNLEQATADLHHINQLFKQIYKDKWISTGISKGGQTTIFYRYFYPDDVDVSIPYVAPLNYNMEDQRIYEFLDTVGSEACRKKIEDVQFFLLKNRKEVLARLKWFAQGQGLTFRYLDDSLEAAFEYAVLEYPFSFWQWGSKCEDLPTSGILDDYIQSLVDIVGLEFYGDASMTLFAPHYHQASLEMGYYGFRTEKFEPYLKVLSGHPNASFPPKGVNYNFDDSLNKKVMTWLDKSGDHFVYINGLWDTWSATRVRPKKKRKAISLDLPKTDHGQARVRNLSEAQKTAFSQVMKDWLDIDLDYSVLSSK